MSRPKAKATTDCAPTLRSLIGDPALVDRIALGDKSLFGRPLQGIEGLTRAIARRRAP